MGNQQEALVGKTYYPVVRTNVIYTVYYLMLVVSSLTSLSSRTMQPRTISFRFEYYCKPLLIDFYYETQNQICTVFGSGRPPR